MTIKISAIVCTYNRKAFLTRCLDSLLNQNYHDYEVIVVDDGSTDGTPQFVNEYKKKVPSNVTFRYIQHKRNRGLGVARNTAVKNAFGMVVAFTDDDCVVSRDWVANIARYHFNYPEVAAVGGLVFNGCADNVIAEIGQQMVTYLLYDQMIDDQYTNFLVGNNQSYKKEVIEQVQYFEGGLIYGGEDAEIQSRLIGRGYKMIFSPDITVTHFQRSTFKSFLKQYYRYGIGEYVVYLKNRYNDDLYKSRFKSNIIQRIVRPIKRPYEVSKYLEKRREKILCYPFVYLASVARAMGFIAAAFGAR